MKENRIGFFPLISAVSILLSNYTRSEVNVKRVFVAGNYTIGALFPKEEISGCDYEITEFDGPQIAEAAFFAVDLINKNKDILPNVTLGLDIRYYSNVVTAVRQSFYLCDEAVSRSNGTEDIFSTAQKNIESPLIGVIGPDDYETAMEVEHFLKNYNTVQMGYSNSLIHFPILEWLMYPFYFSDVPGPSHMTEAILDILVNNNWTYVSLIFSGEDSFSEAGATHFKELAPERGVCVGHTLRHITLELFSKAMKKTDPFKDDDAKELWNDLILPALENVDVIVCYYKSSDNALFEVLQIVEARLSKRFVVITGDGWFHDRKFPTEIRFDTDRTIRDTIVGEIRLNVKQTYIKEFNDYYSKLKGKKMLVQDNKRNLKIFYVAESVFILAHALHDMLLNGCKDFRQEHFLPMENNFYKDCYKTYVGNLRFDFYGRSVEFKNYPNMPRVVDDDDETIKMEKGKKIMHHPKKTFVNYICNQPCLPNQAKILRTDKCCWDCHTCEPLEKLKNETRCVRCPDGFMSNSNKTDCIPIPMKYTAWFDAQTIFMVSVSLLSIILTSFTLYIFVTYGHTPVVKSSTKELCYIMFVGMFVANLTPFVTVLKPNATSCMTVQALPPISFALIYAALFVKTNRIARILAISKKKFPNMNPKFLSLKAQIMFTIMLICIEVTICVFFLRHHPIKPELILLPKGNPSYGVEICPLKDDILSEVYAYVGILKLICTYYQSRIYSIGRLGIALGRKGFWGAN